MPQTVNFEVTVSATLNLGDDEQNKPAPQQPEVPETPEQPSIPEQPGTGTGPGETPADVEESDSQSGSRFLPDEQGQGEGGEAPEGANPTQDDAAGEQNKPNGKASKIAAIANKTIEVVASATGELVDEIGELIGGENTDGENKPGQDEGNDKPEDEQDNENPDEEAPADEDGEGDTPEGEDAPAEEPETPGDDDTPADEQDSAEQDDENAEEAPKA